MIVFTKLLALNIKVLLADIVMEITIPYHPYTYRFEWSKPFYSLERLVLPNMDELISWLLVGLQVLIAASETQEC